MFRDERSTVLKGHWSQVSVKLGIGLLLPRLVVGAVAAAVVAVAVVAAVIVAAVIVAAAAAVFSRTRFTVSKSIGGIAGTIICDVDGAAVGVTL